MAEYYYKMPKVTCISTPKGHHALYERYNLEGYNLKNSAKRNLDMKIETNVTLVAGTNIKKLDVKTLKGYIRGVCDDIQECEEFLECGGTTDADSYSVKEMNALKDKLLILNKELDGRELEDD